LNFASKVVRQELILCNCGFVCVRRRRFPPKIQLLTEEEYRAQGIEETRKALEGLRRYCHSPECNAWKTMSRLSSPVQCVSVMFLFSHIFSFSQPY